MPESRLPDLPAPSPVAIPSPAPLPVNIDTGLLHSASARWRESSQALNALFAGIPATRETLRNLLAQQLDLDGSRVGLNFTASEQSPERFVSLTSACAFVFQQPQLEATLDTRCQVVGLNAGHALFALTPTQMLERLKALNLTQALDHRWNAYWDARAPATPVSRRERAAQLYREHLESSAQVALARRSVSAEQLQPLLSAMDASSDVRLNERPVSAEQPVLLLNNHSKMNLPGAWVITIGDAVSSRHLLYLPSRPVPLQAFERRSDMQAWLTGQALIPQGLPEADLRFEYVSRPLPLSTGLADLLESQRQARLAALRDGSHGRQELAEHGPQALALADQMDRQQKNDAVFASAPRLPNAGSASDAVDGDELPPFGSLYSDIPWALRQAALNRQRDALEALLGENGDNRHLQPFKDEIKALETAEQAADSAATALLHRPRTFDLTTFNRQFTALYQAHKSGLHAEAKLQKALGQLDDEDLQLLEAFLSTPEVPGQDRVAASLTLSMNEQGSGQGNREELHGPFVLTHRKALTDRQAEHCLLLYWPGNGAGLQRFTNRRALERQLFKIGDRETTLTLQLTIIRGDPLHYALDTLASDFEEQAGEIRQRLSAPTQASVRDEQLDALRKRSLATLLVPAHAARSLAFSNLLEQNRSGTLASRLPDWLSALSTADHAAFKQLIEAYIAAMHKSHQRMTVDLPPRDDFTRRHLHARLRKDFSLNDDFQVHIDLPDSVTLQKQLSSGSTQTTPQKLVAVPSVTRSKMSLEDLAQHNIDNTPSMNLEPLSLRLGFMRVEVTTANEGERQTLTSGITRAYLKRTLPELDLPSHYEKLIYDTFMGSVSEPPFISAHRRECLIEPWRLMLKLQGECARLQQHISHADQQLLNIAIDADTAEAWRAEGKRIVLLAAYLSAGGKDTPGEGPVTLSGVTFIQEQISGVTLLYLPDSPDNRFLRRYADLEAARKGLFNLCLRSEMVSYLAGRALLGNVRAHESRIHQAVQKNFAGMIGVGARWPATTSLAAHLLNAHMGRLIEAHRGTSRSNGALYQERYALAGPRAFNYMKMALGVVPFVGSALALYDAWGAANQAVAAFLRGDVGDGLMEIESVLLSLIDALMDLAPGEVAFSSLSRAARSLTRARQSHLLMHALKTASHRQARHVAARFVGYEYEQPISLSGLHPARHGLYRNIYRHAEGDFIVRQGRIFQVERSNDSRGWRLRGTRKATYKQPIALDEHGQWDTWFGVYGTTFEGGGLGGGAVLGHMADALDPLWPQVIRQRLPRWWAERMFRRHHQLTAAADDLAPQLNTRVQQTEAVLKKYYSTPAANRGLMRHATEVACAGDIELAIRRYQTLADLHPLTHGNKARVLREMQSEVALLIAGRHCQRLYFARHQIDALLERMDDFADRLDDLAGDALVERRRIREDIRTVRLDLMPELDLHDDARRQFNLWYERTTLNSHKSALRTEHLSFNEPINESYVLFSRTEQLLEIVERYDAASELSWFDLNFQADTLRYQVDRALFTQFNLPEATATKAQRSQILRECLNLYLQFERSMKIWTITYPQHFHTEAVEPLLAGIRTIAERARKHIETPATPRLSGPSDKKVFTTEDDQLLIGVERWVPTTQTRQYTLSGRGGQVEIWEQGANGKSRLLNPPQPQTASGNLETYVNDARKRLDSLPAYEVKVSAYMEQDMLPVDLEHMLVSEAEELNRRARRIEELAPRHRVIQRLRARAAELIASGRQMRTRQSLNSKQPTDGMLEDLIAQNVVQIRKTGPMQSLARRKDGRADFMQEYEIFDTTRTPARLLWYAHFHYTRATPVFNQFEKAHLKLPEHRFLTHADNADLPYADIGIRSTVLTHFEQL